MSQPNATTPPLAGPDSGSLWNDMIRFRRGDITFEEFLTLVADGEKSDLLNGVIYVASPDNKEAAYLSVWLCQVVGGFVERKDLGKIFMSRVACRIGPDRGPEPDLGFISKELEHTHKRGYVDGPPSLAVEIVSPDSAARDYVLKRSIYEEAGVPEYWIIDPDERRTTFLRLREGRYQEIQPVDHVFSSAVLPGFRLDVRWLWQPRPPAYEVLEQLLRSS